MVDTATTSSIFSCDIAVFELGPRIFDSSNRIYPLNGHSGGHNDTRHGVPPLFGRIRMVRLGGSRILGNTNVLTNAMILTDQPDTVTPPQSSGKPDKDDTDRQRSRACGLGQTVASGCALMMD